MIDLEELKRWATARLDYEDNEIGKEHSAYGGHYFAGVLAIVAKLEAAQRLRDALADCNDAWESLCPVNILAAFDKEQS